MGHRLSRGLPPDVTCERPLTAAQQPCVGSHSPGRRSVWISGACTNFVRDPSRMCRIRSTRERPNRHQYPLFVLVQPEMEKRRSPLVSIPPFGRGFSRHGVFRSDGGWAAQERALTPPFIVSMSPPGYPSAWLRPRSARFRFARQNHCNSATSCRFSTSGLSVTPPEPRPARPES
jgi:hypothetical protein